MTSNFAWAEVVLGARSYQGARQYNNWVSYYHTAPPEKTSSTPSSPLTCVRYCQFIKTHSQTFNVPESLIIAIIHHESRFNHKAVSPKGAKGLMQLMDINSVGIDPFNPDENIQAGTRLMARLLNKYNDTRLALAAYNAGEGNVAKYNGIPPFPETQQYVQNVLRHYQP